MNKNDKFKRNFNYYSAWSECAKISYKYDECEIVIKPGIYKVEVYDIIHYKESINSSNLLSKEISIDEN